MDNLTQSRTERTVASLLIVSWLAFAGPVLIHPQRSEYDGWRNLVLYNIPFALAASACLWRSWNKPMNRLAWRLLGIGLVLYVAGSCYGTLFVGNRDIYPSPADGLWLSFYVLAYIAIACTVREQMTEFRIDAWLDGAIGGFGAAALVVAFALGPVLEQTAGKFAVVATNLAYPVADVLLIIFIVSAATAVQTKARAWWLLGGGLALFCVGDVIFLFQGANGTYAEGGIVDVTWPLGAVLLGLAAQFPAQRVDRSARPPQRYAVPTTFTVTSVGVLVYGQSHHMHVMAVLLAVAAIAAGATRMFFTVREVTSLAESRREARTDELTGLANRRAFTERLEASLARPGSHAVFIMDLDAFKEVNDSLGHDAGDDLLRWVAARLSSVLPPGQLARLGGDEFGAVIPIVDLSDAVALARRTVAALEGPVRLGTTTVRVSASLGIAVSPLHGHLRTELVRFADMAMYEAKRTQTTYSVFDPNGDPATADQLERTSQLAEAITQRRLELHYQPTIDLASGRPRGIEALVRWRLPDGSLLFPDSFIPLAERAGLIRQITRSTLLQAISFHAGLRRTRPHLYLNVNVSGHDLLDESLPEYVSELLDRFALQPSLLTLEITETALVADLSRAHRSIAALRQLGIRISVDDFGVGYSSMAQLIGFQVDELKIDKTFVTHLDSDSRMRAIVRSMIELGHALQLMVVAEGVESEQTCNLLDELGCDLAQGFHISRPLLPSEVDAFFEVKGPLTPVAAALT